MSVLSNERAGSSGAVRPLTFSEKVQANSTERARYTVPEAGVIEEVTIRIYPGARLDLHIYPYINRGGDGTTVPLIRTQGKNYVDGDDDVWEWRAAFPIREEDEIVVEATNKDSSNAYDYRVNMTVDYGFELSEVL